MFLLVALVTGTLTAISPSSFIIAQAQAQVEYGYNDKNGYNSEYLSHENNYNNFDPSNYSHAHTVVVPTDFPTIQDAIDAANDGDIIKVLSGTYTEQITIGGKILTIIGSGAKSTIIEVPLPLEELDTNVIGRPYIVEVNSDAKVTMKGFTIKGLEDPNCDVLFGVTVLGDATLKLDSAIIKGCTFAGIVVGILLTSDDTQTGHATVTNTVITDYQKYGVSTEGVGSTLKMSYNKVIGSNYEGFDTDEVKIPSNLIGIYFTHGAQATITHNEVSRNICILTDICGPDWFNQLQAAGIGFCNKSFISSSTSDNNLSINIQQENLRTHCPFINGTIPTSITAPEIDVQQENSNKIGSLFMPIQTNNNLDANIAVNAGPGSSIISNNYASNNDVGISVTGEESGCCIIDHNKPTDNRFFGIVIADGEHTISNTKIFGGNIGVAAIAVNANTVATLDDVNIINAETSIQALSSNDLTASVKVVSSSLFGPLIDNLFPFL